MKWMRRQTAWIAGAAVGGVILWLVGTVASLQATRAEAAGSLFGKPVSIQAYQKTLEAVTHEALLTHGDKFRQEVSREDLENQAWERLMMLAEARGRRIRVSDEEVAEFLQKWPLFQKDGQFDMAGYRAILQYSLGTTPHGFEEEIREALTLRKLFDQALGTPTVTEAELREGFRRREEAIRVSLLALPNEALAKEVIEAARQQPKQLAKVAKQLSMKVTTTDFFKRSGTIPELGGLSGTALEPAFSLEPGGIAGPLAALGKKWLAVKLDDKQPPVEEKFYELRENLERELKSTKHFKKSLTWYQDLLKRADMKKHLPGSPKK